MPEHGESIVVLDAGHSVTHYYARLPKEVLFSQQIDPYAKLVYAALAFECFQGATACVGTRTLASKLNISRNQVKLSLQKLQKTGYVVRADKTIRSRAVYVLKSGVFWQKQGAKTEMVSGPRRRMVSVSPEDVA